MAGWIVYWLAGSNQPIQPIQYSQPIYNPASQYNLTDAPSSDFPPFPVDSAARHLLSSSAAASSAAFFASNLDGAVSKVNFLAFLIASPTGQSLEEMRKCLTDPHFREYGFL